MTGPRIPHTRAGVRWTGGDDRPVPACATAEGIEAVDAMIDHRADTAAYRRGRSALAIICARCPFVDCADRVTIKPCGTEAAYRRHLYNNEKPCLECRAASARAKREHKARKEAA